MAAGVNEIYILENNGYSVEVALTETYEIMPNVSAVSVGLRVKSAYVRDVEYLSGFIKLDGKTLVTMDSTLSTHHVQISYLNTWYNVVKSSNAYTDSPWTMDNFIHNTDGSKEITLDVELKGYGSDNYLNFRVAASKKIQLTHIPRASSVGASDANIGAVSTLSVIRRSPDYMHSIAYVFGYLTGYLNADGSLTEEEVKLTETSIPFFLPENFYDQIPNKPTGECWLTVKTYLGDEQIGDAQTTSFTVTAAERLCAPDVAGTVEDINPDTIALTGDKNILVRYVSNALCTITATAKNGASIASKAIAGEIVEEHTRNIEAVETGTIEFRCTDSRGYENSVSIEKVFVPYTHLTASASASRRDPTSGNGSLEVSGSCFHGGFGLAENEVTVHYSVNGGAPVPVEVVIDAGAYKAQADLTGLDYQRSHTITVTVSDKIETVTNSAKVGKGIPVFDWDNDDFQFHVPVFLGGNVVGELADPEDAADAVSLGYAQNAFAPAGFGVGAVAVPIDSLDNAKAFGLTSSNIGAPDEEQWTCLTIPYSSRCATQIAWRAEMSSKTVLEARRQKYGTTWGEWVTDEGDKRVLVWENKNLASAFDAQFIDLDLEECNGVEIVYYVDETTNVYLNTGFVPRGLNSALTYTTASLGFRLLREFIVNSDGIEFKAGSNTGSVPGNKVCIPYQIYVVKGIRNALL